MVDLGCGTGQLTLPLAARVGTVIGMDPEPDMLNRARNAATRAGLTTVTWLPGTDRDLATLTPPIGALTIAVAIHWMDRAALFADARRLLRPGGGIAVVTNGAPLWAQDTDWTRALRECLHEWTGQEPSGCQTDAEGRRLTAEALRAAGYEVTESEVEYDAPLSIEAVIGGVRSAVREEDLPVPEERFAAALRPFAPLTETVSV